MRDPEDGLGLSASLLFPRFTPKGRNRVTAVPTPLRATAPWDGVSLPGSCLSSSGCWFRNVPMCDLVLLPSGFRTTRSFQGVEGPLAKGDLRGP